MKPLDVDALRAFITRRSQRSSYIWSEYDSDYLDAENEGQIQLANEILDKFFNEASPAVATPTRELHYIVDEESRTVLYVSGDKRDCEYMLCKYLNDGCDAYLINNIQGYAVTTDTLVRS